MQAVRLAKSAHSSILASRAFFEGEECFGCGAFNGEGVTAELTFIEHACAVFFLNNDTRFRRDLQPVR